MAQRHPISAIPSRVVASLWIQFHWNNVTALRDRSSVNSFYTTVNSKCNGTLGVWVEKILSHISEKERDWHRGVCNCPFILLAIAKPPTQIRVHNSYAYSVATENVLYSSARNRYYRTFSIVSFGEISATTNYCIGRTSKASRFEDSSILESFMHRSTRMSSVIVKRRKIFNQSVHSVRESPGEGFINKESRKSLEARRLYRFDDRLKNRGSKVFLPRVMEENFYRGYV